MESKSTSKAIAVDKDKLTDYIIDNCPLLLTTVEGSSWCHKKRDRSCLVPRYEREHCPRDCPHMAERAEWECDGGKCSYVKKIIKEMKAT